MLTQKKRKNEIFKQEVFIKKSCKWNKRKGEGGVKKRQRFETASEGEGKSDSLKEKKKLNEISFTMKLACYDSLLDC